MNATTTPRAWVGCLGCYNEGRLAGEWFDADSIPVDTSDWTAVSTDACSDASHEELWVFDHEGFGPLLTGECSPVEARRLGELIESVPEWQREAFLAWVGTGDYVADVDGPSLSDFEERYAGEWDSEEDFAYQLAEDIGALPAEYSWPASHIDWERATRDLFMCDYASTPAPGGGVFVFRVL